MASRQVLAKDVKFVEASSLYEIKDCVFFYKGKGRCRRATGKHLRTAVK